MAILYHIVLLGSNFFPLVSKIFDWINNNHLILNYNKCCLINFFLRKNILKNNNHITIHGHNFIFSSHTKYLGIIFDEHLSFAFQYKKNCHVNAIISNFFTSLKISVTLIVFNLFFKVLLFLF